MGKKNDDRVTRLLVAAAILADGGSAFGDDRGSDDLDAIVEFAERAAALKQRDQRGAMADPAMGSTDALAMSRDSN